MVFLCIPTKKAVTVQAHVDLILYCIWVCILWKCLGSTLRQSCVSSLCVAMEKMLHISDHWLLPKDWPVNNRRPHFTAIERSEIISYEVLSTLFNN